MASAIKAVVKDVGADNLTKIIGRFRKSYDVYVGLPNTGQRYQYSSYEYERKGRGAPRDKSSRPLPLVAQVGYWQVFGTKTSPKRDFLIKTVRNNVEIYREMQRKIALKVLRQEMDLQKGLSLVGVKAQSDVQRAIKNWKDPPNAPSTIKRKGRNSPLRYKGTLLQAVLWQLRKRK